MGEWRNSSTIIDLGTRWWRVVRFTSQPLYPGKWNGKTKLKEVLNKQISEVAVDSADQTGVVAGFCKNNEIIWFL
jgi:predicted transposase